MLNHRLTHRLCGILTLFMTALLGVETARASVSYTTPGATLTQDFNGLPTDTVHSASIQATPTGGTVNYADGWQDDVDPAVSTESDVSIPGWYLFHPLVPTTGTPPENGFNDHQRLRFGTGASNTGSFYGFATGSGNPEKAMGFVPSTTLATNPVADPTVSNDDTMFIAWRLTNNSGETLNEFTLGYNGEQWRDGGRDGAASTVKFSWVVTPADAPASTAHRIADYTPVTELGFTSPVNVTGTTGAAVDGNAAGRVAVNSFTVSGINWTSGSDLWLRWGDQQLAGNDHGMAIDDVVFSANIGAPPVGVPGDYNGNGSVDAADYVLWREGGPLQNEVDTPGTVDANDYTEWRARFGNPPGSGVGLGTGAVPEPATLSLIGVSIVVICALRRRCS